MEHRVRALSGLVSLLTDFGDSDTYVGQIKAIMLGINPSLVHVDLTHHVPPQDVTEGAFQLATGWEAFPPGTVHLAVVDPGVGTPRRPLAFRFREHLFVLPDNGLGSLVLERHQPDEVVMLDVGEFHRGTVSSTFHGRDLFAPVAAHLASGRALSDVGTSVEPVSMERLDLALVETGDQVVRGPVVSIDRFGNCRTLIRANQLPGPVEQLRVRCGPATIRGIVRTYGAVPEGRTLALFGSHGGLEIAVRLGSAARAWEIERGMIVEVSL